MSLKHNLNTGFINHCQICNSKKILPVIDLGFQPLADDLKNNLNRNDKIISYPIKIYFCPKCRLLQNNYIVGDNTLYTKNYHYRPGISKTVVENQYALAKKIKNIYNLKSKELIVDIGSNDGTLLNQFKKQGLQNLFGIEPTDTINFQKKIGIKSLQKFFNLHSSNIVKKKSGKAKIIITTNVFAHSNNMKDFISGVKNLISKNGVFVIENHYLLDVLKNKQFDTFYHEHLRTYSLKSLIKLLKYYGFKVVDAYCTDRYGGNIQAHFALNESKIKSKNKNIQKILKNEVKEGLDKPETYYKFKKDIDVIGNNLKNFLVKNKKKHIVAKAFPARASVIIHYFSFIKDHISYIAEQSTSLKLGHYIPGTNIQIIDSKQMKKNKPDILIVLAWHLFDPIHKKWLNNGLNRTKFVKPLPKLNIK